jgi:hypothetical protein
MYAFTSATTLFPSRVVIAIQQYPSVNSFQGGKVGKCKAKEVGKRKRSLRHKMGQSCAQHQQDELRSPRQGRSRLNSSDNGSDEREQLRGGGHGANSVHINSHHSNSHSKIKNQQFLHRCMRRSSRPLLCHQPLLVVTPTPLTDVSSPLTNSPNPLLVPPPPPPQDDVGGSATSSNHNCALPSSHGGESSGTSFPHGSSSPLTGPSYNSEVAASSMSSSMSVVVSATVATNAAVPALSVHPNDSFVLAHEHPHCPHDDSSSSAVEGGSTLGETARRGSTSKLASEHQPAKSVGRRGGAPSSVRFAPEVIVVLEADEAELYALEGGSINGAVKAHRSIDRTPPLFELQSDDDDEAEDDAIPPLIGGPSPPITVASSPLLDIASDAEEKTTGVCKAEEDEGTDDDNCMPLLTFMAMPSVGVVRTTGATQDTQGVSPGSCVVTGCESIESMMASSMSSGNKISGSRLTNNNTTTSVGGSSGGNGALHTYRTTFAVVSSTNNNSNIAGSISVSGSSCSAVAVPLMTSRRHRDGLARPRLSLF